MSILNTVASDDFQDDARLDQLTFIVVNWLIGLSICQGIAKVCYGNHLCCYASHMILTYHPNKQAYYAIDGEKARDNLHSSRSS